MKFDQKTILLGPLLYVVGPDLLSPQLSKIVKLFPYLNYLKQCLQKVLADCINIDFTLIGTAKFQNINTFSIN